MSMGGRANTVLSFQRPQEQTLFFLFKERFQLTPILKISLNVEKQRESAYVASNYKRGEGRFEHKPIVIGIRRFFFVFHNLLIYSSTDH